MILKSKNIIEREKSRQLIYSKVIDGRKRERKVRPKCKKGVRKTNVLEKSFF